MTSPWHKWFHSTWLASETRFEMTAAERGIYRDALDLNYAEGSIPANLDALRRILAVDQDDFDQAWPKVSQHFEPLEGEPSRLSNPKAAQVLAETEKYRLAQADKGRRGGKAKAARQGKKRKPAGEKAPGWQVPESGCSQNLASARNRLKHEDISITPYSPPLGDGSPAVNVCSFDSWWAEYPHQVSKPAARTAFNNVVLTGKPPQGATSADFDGLDAAEARFERLMESTKAWAREFAKRPADKVPHPATFLNRLDWVNPPVTGKPNFEDRDIRRAWERDADSDVRMAWQ